MPDILDFPNSRQNRSGRCSRSQCLRLLIQTILVIAYFPVVKRLWNAERNTESFAV